MGMVIAKVMIRITVTKRYLQHIWNPSHSWDLALHTITHERCCWSEGSKVKLKVKEEGERKKKEGEKKKFSLSTPWRHIRGVGTTGRCVVKFMPWLLYSQQRTLLSIEQDLGGPQHRFRCFGKEKIKSMWGKSILGQDDKPETFNLEISWQQGPCKSRNFHHLLV